ncbi:MAG TPA: alpha-amylase family glycosyl hydrolase [Thermoleophilaceae bacterium]|nr:alpha-amylase family glycosyl hydrolase [Thermoleophilaceae bacterium]
MASWWQDAVVYQIYPRSFQDTNGDGTGDLAGVARRLDHLAELGAAAFWLSPVYPSPLADFGYDISAYTAIDTVFGDLDEFDALIAAAHERGIRVLMDLVPSHTSIEHPWFREHPDWYIWAPGDGPPNRWTSAFGGSAWSRDPGSGRWYLHSFFPEQADLDWRNPEVHDAMARVMRFWLDRGVDGFRIDALDRVMKDRLLRDDPPAREPFGLPLRGDEEQLQLIHSRNDPDIVQALAVMRAAAGDALLVGEVYLRSALVKPYLEYLDTAFAFELYQSPWQADALRGAITRTLAAGAFAWVLSNHDFPRLVTRYGAENAASAALILLTLPGLAFVYAGDEIGMPDGPGVQPPLDRAGRDSHRHPMQWEPGALGGFTTGTPWLPLINAPGVSVAEQEADDDSLLGLYRRLIALRPLLGTSLEMLDSDPAVVAYRRGDYVVAINAGLVPVSSPATGEVIIATRPAALAPNGKLAANAAVITQA